MATPVTPAGYFGGNTPPASHAASYSTTPQSHNVSGYGAIPASHATPTLEANKVIVKSDVAGVTRRTLASAHTFVLASLFLPPFVLILCLGLNDEVAYFAGRRSLFPILLLPLLVVVPLIHLLYKPKQATFYLLTVLVPAIVFASVGGMVRETTEIAANAMYNRDCFTFAEKRSLFRAYQAALKVKDDCHGTSAAIEQCEGYGALQKTHARELKYLSSLEHRFKCAGICHSSVQLFEHPGEEAPPCGLFVAQWLKGASGQSYAVLWYAIFIILISFPSWQMLVQPMLQNVP